MILPSRNADGAHEPECGPHQAAGLVVLTAAAGIVAGLPVALIGALAVLIDPERPLLDVQVGLIFAVFSAVTVLSAWPAGWLSDALGPIRTIQIAAATTAICLLAVGVGSLTYGALLLVFAFAGAANAGTLVSANHLLATRLDAKRQGLAFGIKQASVPAAPMVAGAAIPAVGLTVGWQWAFALSAVVSASVALLAAPMGRFRANMAMRAGPQRRPTTAVLILMMGAFLGAAAGNTLPAFVVRSAVAEGISVPDAGALLAIGGVSAVLARVIMGWLADRIGGDPLEMVAGLLGLGVVGFILLAATPFPGAFMLGVILAFGGGWGWAGLLWLRVARLSILPVAKTMATVQVSASAGGAAGPLLFGIVASFGTYSVAWFSAGLSAAAAALVILRARHLLPRDPTL